MQESYLEIRQAGTGRVVTVLELLSPKNKRAGTGRDNYNAKHTKILASQTHLVEIDLLRAGESPPVSVQVNSDYRILVSRAVSIQLAGCHSPLPAAAAREGRGTDCGARAASGSDI